MNDVVRMAPTTREEPTRALGSGIDAITNRMVAASGSLFHLEKRLREVNNRIQGVEVQEEGNNVGLTEEEPVPAGHEPRLHLYLDGQSALIQRIESAVHELERFV